MRWWWCLDDGVPPFRKGLSLEGLLTGECPLDRRVSISDLHPRVECADKKDRLKAAKFRTAPCVTCDICFSGACS